MSEERLAFAAKAAMGQEAGLALVDERDRFVFVNQAFVRLLGRENWEELVGQPWQVALPEDVAGQLRDRFSPELVLGGRWEGNVTARQPDGGLVRFSLCLSREPDGMVVWQARSDQVTGDLDCQTCLWLDRQGRQMQMQREFVSLLSHEFRTPLATAQSVIFLLERELAPKADQPKMRRWIGLLKEAMATQRSLVDQVLLLNRLETGPQSAACPAVNVRDMLDAMTEATGELRGPTLFRCEIAPDTPVTLKLNVSLVRLVVEAFLSNATKYAAPDSPVVLRVRAAGHTGLRLAVFNQGAALTEEERARMWEPFFRGSAAKQVPGVGLGLPIVRRAAGLMGARVGCDEAPDGLEFWLEVQADD